MVMGKQFSDLAQYLMLKLQKNSLNAAIIYCRIATKILDKHNRKILRQIANDEFKHSKIWQKYTHVKVTANWLKIFFYDLVYYLLGYTFVVKLLKENSYKGICCIENLRDEIPSANKIIVRAEENNRRLIALLNEERLNYIGAMVLGLNDALVELTGTIAGLTFVLMNTTLIALAGIITGIAATLSMSASNYLAERANNNPLAFKASIYTGVCYLLTVCCLVTPYLLLPPNFYVYALAGMVIIAILLIAFFNFYVAVLRGEKFWPKFLEMAAISSGVAIISFAIGLLAKLIFGITA